MSLTTYLAVYRCDHPACKRQLATEPGSRSPTGWSFATNRLADGHAKNDYCADHNSDLPDYERLARA